MNRLNLALILAFSLPEISGATGFSYELNDGNGETSSCNGAAVHKRKLKKNSCEVGIVTAEHCLSESGSERFGTDYMKKVEIRGAEFDIIAAEKSPETNHDTAVFFVRGDCKPFENIPVDSMQTESIDDKSGVLYKSEFWAHIDYSLGYRGRTKEIAGKRLTGTVSAPSNIPGILEFSIDGGETIEPGDSGLPVYVDGKIVGVLSGSPGNPPFHRFWMGNYESMRWASETVKSHFGLKNLL